MVTRTTPPDLAGAVEALLLRGPAPSPFMRYLDITGVTASMGPSSVPNDNRVGLTDVEPQRADALIARVIATYRGCGRGVSWIETPRSRPTDLARRLEAHGFVHTAADDMAGMASAAAATFDAPADTDVRVVDLTELRRHVHLMAQGFGAATERFVGILDMYEAGALPGSAFGYYLAYADAVAVGYATSLIDHDRGVMLLGGSAVLPAYRGRGHYRALVRARLCDAHRRGAAAVVVQARRTTSAPILVRLGFEEVMPIRTFTMPAPGRGTPAPLD
jgi:GNAT superfamily N-acetyltransferase